MEQTIQFIIWFYKKGEKNPRKYYFIQFICSDYFILCIGHEVEPIYWSSFLYLFELVCFFRTCMDIIFMAAKLYRI